MAKRLRPKAVHQLTSAQFDRMFPVGDEDACKRYLVARRWPKGVCCTRCGNPGVYDLPSREWHWQCSKCAPDGYRFSVLVGTIFENTNKPLRDWYKLTHLIMTSKKGMSARQLGRYLGCAPYTALLMGHKVRAALLKPEEKLGGIVEVDETFVGGKNRNRHFDNKRDGTGGPGSGKAIVAGAVKRKGNVIARVVANVRRDTLEQFIRESVSEKVSLLCTDQWVGYRHLHKDFPHAVIDHSRKQYVVGAVHTNTIEGFWSIFKRGVVGTFHKISAKYLPLYVAEFEFRYNNRENDDIFGAAISRC